VIRRSGGYPSRHAEPNPLVATGDASGLALHQMWGYGLGKPQHLAVPTRFAAMGGSA